MERATDCCEGIWSCDVDLAGRQGFGTVRAECNEARRFPTAVPTGRQASNEVVSEMAGRQGFEPR